MYLIITKLFNMNLQKIQEIKTNFSLFPSPVVECFRELVLITWIMNRGHEMTSHLKSSLAWVTLHNNTEETHWCLLHSRCFICVTIVFGYHRCDWSGVLMHLSVLAHFCAVDGLFWNTSRMMWSDGCSFVLFLNSKDLFDSLQVYLYFEAALHPILLQKQGRWQVD